MKTLLAVIAFGLALCARADVIIYKAKATFTLTGAGASTRQSVGGYAVLDTDTFEFGFVATRKSGALKTFFRPDLSDEPFVDFPTGALGKNYSVFSLADDFVDADGFLHLDTYFLKGVDAPLDIGTGVINFWPKTMAGTSRSVYRSVTDEVIIEEATEKLTFDKTTTVLCNAGDDDFEDAIDRIETILISQGYVAE